MSRMIEIQSSHTLQDLVSWVKSGVEVVLTEDQLPVARVVASTPSPATRQPTTEVYREGQDEPSPTMTLAERQYQLARQYPEDWVVLVGERIIDHSPDRKTAFQAFDNTVKKLPGVKPVLVEPGGGKRRMPIVRGRSVKLPRPR